MKDNGIQGIGNGQKECLDNQKRVDLCIYACASIPSYALSSGVVGALLKLYKGTSQDALFTSDLTGAELEVLSKLEGNDG